MWQDNQDVCRLQELLALEARKQSVVVFAHLCLFGSFRHEQRTYLLVAILAELFLIAGERIQLVIEGGLDLELVVHEEVHILIDVLLVYDAFRVVLIIVVFKLTASDGDSIDAHHDGVFLSGSRHSDGYQR